MIRSVCTAYRQTYRLVVALKYSMSRFGLSHGNIIVMRLIGLQLVIFIREFIQRLAGEVTNG